MFALEFPLPGFPPFLRYDPSAVPALFAGIVLGTPHGLALGVVKDILYLFTGKSSGGVLGVAADLTFVLSSVWATGLCFWTLRSRFKRLEPVWVVSLAVGLVVGTVVMSTANYFVFLPIWGIPQDQLMPMVLGAIVPFNLVKGVLNGVFTYLLLQSPLRGVLRTR
jgi:riboflavin transporter FmnP